MDILPILRSSFMIVLLDSFQEAEEAHILSTRNAYIPFASGHAGFYHPGVNRGWRDPRAHSGTARGTRYAFRSLEHIKPAAIRRIFPNNTKMFL